jgi:putative ABC transport system ATP-binding protein
MTKTGNPILEARDLCKTYGSGDSAIHALKNVSLEVYDGELLAILGSSGSGKSTLLNMLGGLDRPDSGSVRVNGLELERLDERGLTRYRREDVGFVFQSFNLIAELTARENVAMTADPSVPRAAEQALESMGLGARLDSYPSQLSGGEQQRVSIARALAKHPRLLLCDEPTGALDYETGKQILAELELLVRDQGKAVVIVTHTKEIGKIAHRIMRMRSGQIVETQSNPVRLTAMEIEW